MAQFAYEVIGPAAANGWQTSQCDAPRSTAAAAWHDAAKIAQRSDSNFAATLAKRTTTGTVDHDGTRYEVMRIA